MNLAELQQAMIAWVRTGEPEHAARIGGGAGAGVYLGNHRAALMAALASAYPQLERWIGEAPFAAAAAHHVDAVDPVSWTLDAYGADFDQTLAQLHADQGELADLARLEWALGQAFIAADAPAMAVADLAAIDWECAVLRPVPAARVLRLGTNAAAILAALLEDAEPPAPVAAGGPVLVWRADGVPRFRPAEADDLPLFTAAKGLGFAAFCTRLAEVHGPDEGIRRAGARLAAWAGEGLCQRV